MKDRNSVGKVAFVANQYSKEKEYWLNKFSGELKKSSFIYDRFPTETDEEETGFVNFAFPPGISLELIKLSKEMEHRLYMILVAGLTALLYKHTGNSDIIIGSPIFKQEREGEYINTVLPLRILVEERITFKELLLQGVRPTVTEATEHQNYPIETLLFQLDLPVTGKEFPLFDVVILLENIQYKKYVRHVHPNLIFSFSRAAGGEILGKLEYNARLYDHAKVEQIIHHYKRLIERVTHNIDTPISQIDILSEQEKEQLLVEFNGRRTEYPGESSIDRLFEDEASKVPDAIVVTYEDEFLTYKHLNIRANTLATYLRVKGLTKGEPAAVMAENSPQVVLSLLGVLKAGGAYIPLNVEYPDERKKYMVGDSNTTLLLTNCTEANIFQAELTHIDLNNHAIYEQINTNGPVHDLHGGDLAYIIYTSGSTGTPKGVLVEHKSIIRLVKNTNFVQFKKGDSLLLTGALEFDASTFEVWGPLLNGLTLHLVNKDTILNPEKLKESVTRNNVSTMWMTSPLFNQLLDADIEIFAGLRNMLVGGDVLSSSHIFRLKKRFPQVNIIDGYGPTENTTFSTTYLVENEFRENIPIGKPIANSTAYILDGSYSPVPISMPGELYVGGDGLARGYLNRPELTAEKFINIHHYSSYLIHPSILYRTGDLARWLPNGNIEFLGRLDYQVKIRGFRIEPGEIEKRLRQFDFIKEAVVIDRKNKDDEKYLCGYLVTTEETKEKFDAVELRKVLSLNLPDYMVPAYFVLLEKIPLTVNGKVDRRALPEPEITRGGAAFAAPRTLMEEKLIEIWSEVLKIEKEKISIDSDFFELGGHSLRATILISKINKLFNVKVPLAELFNIPSIRELGEYIQRLGKDEFSPLTAVEKKEYYQLSSAQKRHYFLQQLEPGSFVYNVPLTKALHGNLNPQKIEGIFKKLIKRHESLRTSFHMIKDTPVQRIHEDADFSAQYHELLEATQWGPFIKNFIKPFDLSKAPLMRVGLLKIQEEKFILTVDMHHIITDGTSMSLLVDEFIRLYEDKELSILRLQYKDYSEWQNSANEKEILKRQEKYWLRQFEEEIPVLELPTDYPRPAIKSFEGNSIDFQVNPGTFRLLLDIVREEGVTLFIMLLAATNILISKLSRQEDIVIGSPIAGRRHADLEKIIGMFVNTLPLRNYPYGDKTFKEFLRDLKEKTLESFENQEYQFEDLVEKVAIKRDAGRNPLFDVIFLLQNFNYLQGIEFKSGEDGNTVRVSSVDDEIPQTAKFDLSLTGMEKSDGLVLSFGYCTKLYKQATIERFIDYFENIISRIINEPGTMISDIMIMSEAETRRLLYAFNDTYMEYPDDKTIHQLFKEQAAQTPDHIAVFGPGWIETGRSNNVRAGSQTYPITLSYNELDKQSDRLAAVLIEKGGLPDTIVAIMIERSIEIIIGILSILKSGGAYLPLDPEYPEERIDFMLKDSATKLLVTTKDKEIEKLRRWDGEKVLIEEISNSTKGSSYPLTFLPSYLLNSTNLAYIIYTSGSTGNPKGVIVEHRNVINLAISQKKRFAVTERDFIIQFSSICFDASVEQIFITFFSGAVLVLLDKNTLLDNIKFEELISRQLITHFHAVPSFLDSISLKEGYQLKRIIAGGDVCPPGLVEKYGTYCDFYNEYGPTETTVTSIEMLCPYTNETLPYLPIGKPIDNTLVYVLDKWLKPVPFGVTGELYIGGAGVTRGYLNNPGLTDERFKRDVKCHLSLASNSPKNLPNSQWPITNDHLYKTGDLVRWLPNGNMQFLGRIDRQVKIRGFRVELGEIEKQLTNFTHNYNITSIDFKKKIGHTSKVSYCSRCVLPSTYPGIYFDREGICNICREYETIATQARNYFKTIQDFQRLVETARASNKSEYDCMLLFSGGKDSSYVLYRLVEMGLKVLVFTFDNGYISNAAFENIKRIITRLGIDGIVCTAAKMKEIFVESLTCEHTVCTGCFKALTTISTKVAIEKNINMVITGLSRGQIFDTKLHELYSQGIFDVEEIEEKLLLFRKMYHSGGDKISQLLKDYNYRATGESRKDLGKISSDIFTEEVFQNIHFVDFFRYDNTSIKEIKSYLSSKDSFWQKPADTGFCSTNCIINDVGIYIYTYEKGYHNYASPLSWGCRFGKNTREEALSEIEFEPDHVKASEILTEIGYFDRPVQNACVVDAEDKNGNKYLCAYMVPGKGRTLDNMPSSRELRAYLSQVLPDYMVPSFFVPLAKLPLTSTGKVDRKALPTPVFNSTKEYVAPTNPREEKMVKIWSEVLGESHANTSIGINDNFFELGGQSLKTIILAAKIHKEFDVRIPLGEIFKKPTIKRLIEYIDESKLESYERLDPSEKKDYYIQSSAQKRLYILQQIELESIAYNMPQAFFVSGKLDTSKLEMVFEMLIDHHESLRTSFHMINDEPVQRIHDEVEFEIKYLATDAGGEHGQVQTFLMNFIQSFDLAKAPLLRVGLVKEKEDGHILIVDMHHIISDGTSINILVKNFMVLYQGENLPEFRVQYKDFSEWQNTQKQKYSIKRQKEFWTNEFAVQIPVLELPVDYSRPSIQNFDGNSLSFEIDKETVGVLKSLIIETGTTMYMVLFAAYAVFLAKITNQEDLVVGSPSAGRKHADLEEIIGMFVNTLALRNYPSGEKTFSGFLLEVKEKTLNAFENQDYQYEDLVDHVAMSKDVSRNPLFDTMFALQNMDIEGLHIPGLKLSPYPYENKTTKFDLTLSGMEAEDKLFFTFEYCSKLFRKETIKRFIGYFRNIVNGIILDKGKKISDFEIITEEEKKRLLFDFNDTQTKYPKDKTIHELFEEQMERTPDYIASMGPSVGTTHSESMTNPDALASYFIHISYRYLNEKSNQLAWTLRQKSVKPDSIVGIMLEPSVEILIGILGILKAGGAYMAIDPESPQKRILSLLNDCNSPILLTSINSMKKNSFTASQNLPSIGATVIHTAARPQILDLDSMPMTDRSLVNYDKYNRYLGEALVEYSISLQATRGCPYNCLYCHKIWPKKHILRSAENIFEELMVYYNMGVRRFSLIDDIFNLDIKNSSRFFQLIIQNGLNIKIFFPNGLRGDLLTREYIDLMVKAGMAGISLALETASPRLQKLLHKNLNIEKFRHNLEYICEKYPQIILELFIMHGFPTETEDEAILTLDFLKSIKWVHFPHFNILKIFSNTDMAKFAIENGISIELIAESENLAFHELPSTLPFSHNFTKMLQIDYLNNYFLRKERLLHVLPYQMRVLTEDEIIKKYNSYLGINEKNFEDLIQALGISRHELESNGCLDEESVSTPGLNMKIKKHFPSREPRVDALRILLLDLSQSFSHEAHRLNDLVEPPLGLMCLLTYINKKFEDRINGRIAKAFIDFDNFEELKELIKEFKPDLIGIRTLSFYKKFFHRTVANIRKWGILAPIITGGPYATCNYEMILQDSNVDLVVIGEGEVTFSELIGKMLENGNKLPGKDELEKITGIAFIHEKQKLTDHLGREIILFDRLPELLCKEPFKNLGNINRPTDLAYSIFTSGSTGKPKGVIVKHQNIVRLVKNTNFINFTENEKLLQTGAISFDASTLEIWGALLNGLELVLLPKENILTVILWKKALQLFNISIAWMTSPLFNQVVDENKDIFAGLHYLLVGGDTLSPSHIGQVRRRFPNMNIINGYGPTENTTFSTTFRIQRDYTENIPIGAPISNSTAYIVDKYRHLSPIGVPGELCVGGDGIARGYLNNPELTAAKFINFSHENVHDSSFIIHHSILYCTGDFARWLPEGNIEFLGRIDDQVKIRGFRIELGEIEFRLMKYPGIKEAVVTAKADESGLKYLSAYIVSNRELQLSEIREYMLSHLPAYMIPAHFILLEKIPLNANGKIDKKALESNKFGMKRGTEYSAPRSEIEKKIADIWKEVLRLDDVGIFDNFFEIGGNSLNIVVINNKIKTVLKTDLPIVKMFTYPTINSLANYMNQEETLNRAVNTEIKESVDIMEEAMLMLMGDENDNK